MKLFAIASLFALLCCSAPAQTYQQSTTKTNIGVPGQWGCRLNTYICQSVPMTSGDTYTLDETNGVLLPNYAFSWDQTQGMVDTVTEQPPSYGSGPFSLTFSLSDGRSGTLSGTFVLHQVGRGKYAAVEGSTVTFN